MKTRRATLRTSNPASMSASRRRRRRLHRRRCQRRRRLSPITCQRLLHCQTSGDRRSSTSSKKHGGCSRRAWSRLDHRARRRPSPQSGPTTPRDQYYKTEYAITQITARFWFIIKGAKWVQPSAYKRKSDREWRIFLKIWSTYYPGTYGRSHKGNLWSSFVYDIRLSV